MHAYPPSDSPDGRDLLPRRTTPTWEMELLISGATVFSLLQLPALMDAALEGLTPRFDAGMQALVLLPYLYLMTACLALILTFLMHLCVRGYWVALVGLHSVYPQGVQWDALKNWGPAYLHALRQSSRSLPETIEHYDNRASQVFGFGVGLAALATHIGLSVLILIGLTLAVHEASGKALGWGSTLSAAMLVLMGPYLLLYSLDSLLRPSAARFPRLARLLSWSFDRLMRVSLLRGTNLPLLIFSSHVGGGKRGNYLLALALFVLMAAVAARMGIARDSWRLDGYTLFPDATSGARSLDPLRYADQRERLGTRLARIHIPSEVIQDDWLRVFVPFHPARDGQALRRLCPALVASGEPGYSQEAVLACLSKRFVLALDDAPVPSPAFDFASDTAQGVRGVVAMLDISTLPRGRHLLTIREIDAPATPQTISPGAGNNEPTSDMRTDGSARSRTPVQIPFWRQPSR